MMMNLPSFYTNSAELQNGHLPVEAKALWQQTLGELEQTMTQASFNSLLVGSVPIQLFNDTLTVAVPSDQAADWLNHRLKNVVDRTVTTYAGHSVKVLFVSDNKPLSKKIDHYQFDKQQGHLSLPNDPAISPTGLSDMPTSETDFLDGGRKTPDLSEEAYNTFVKPHQVEVFTQYFRKKWRPLLGPLLSELIRELRQRCYNKQKNDDQEVRIEVTQDELAQTLGVSRSTIARMLTRDKQGNFKNHYLSYFIKEMTVLQNRQIDGRVKATTTRFVILVDEPLTPADETRLINDC
jgi:hypothetical protein